MSNEMISKECLRWKDDKKGYFKEYMNREYQCNCGKTIKLGSKSYHMKSKSHRLYVLEQKLEDNIKE